MRSLKNPLARHLGGIQRPDLGLPAFPFLIRVYLLLCLLAENLRELPAEEILVPLVFWELLVCLAIVALWFLTRSLPRAGRGFTRSSCLSTHFALC